VAKGISTAKKTNGISISIRFASIRNFNFAIVASKIKTKKYPRKANGCLAEVATTTKMKLSAATTFK
jgi:hypothetical protein